MSNLTRLLKELSKEVCLNLCGKYLEYKKCRECKICILINSILEESGWKKG